MKNVSSKYLYLFILLFFCVGVSCRSRKNVARTVENQSRVERLETQIDTTRIVATTAESTQEEKSVLETTERETIHFDDSGRVRTIIRESIFTQTGQRWFHRGSGSLLSLSGMETVTGSVETSHEKLNEKTNTQTDSRPVQGAEWLWIIAGSIIAIAAVLLFIKKVK